MGEVWHATKWLQAIFDSDLGPVTRLVAHVYADLAGAGREAWCTNRELRRRTGLSERAARAHRTALVDGGWLVQTKGARHHYAAHFLLAIPAPPAVPGASTDRHEVPAYAQVGGHEVPPVYPQGGTRCRLGGHEVPPREEREMNNSPLSSTSPGADAVAGLSAHDTSSPADPGRWRCPDHVGVLAAGTRCPRCVEEIRTGDRPVRLHGTRNAEEGTTDNE